MSLSSLFGNSNRKPVLSLAIWGPPQSGKTTLLAMINSYCDSYGWTILPAVKETSDYLEAVTKQLFELGKPTERTPVVKPFIHRFALQKPGGWRQKEFVLEMPDASGEMYANPEHGLFSMIEYLSGCEGIMWLLDPVAIQAGTLYGSGENARSYRQMIFRTLSRIFQTHNQGKGRIDKYMAFVLTKMDHPEHSPHFNEPQDYALNLLGKQVERTIESFCVLDRVEFFSTSALGFTDKSRTKSNLLSNGPDDPNAKLVTKDIVPIGVFDPLNWLLSKVT